MIRKLIRKIRAWTPMYWLRTHTIDRYHMLDCRNQFYRWGWLDMDNKIFYAAFACLAFFVEEEEAFDCHIDWDATESHRAAKAEMLELYNWWKTGRAAEHEALSKLGDEMPDIEWEEAPDEFGSEAGLLRMKPFDEKGKAIVQRYAEESDRLDEKDDEMLMRLIKVRHFMWT